MTRNRTLTFIITAAFVLSSVLVTVGTTALGQAGAAAECFNPFAAYDQARLDSLGAAKEGAPAVKTAAEVPQAADDAALAADRWMVRFKPAVPMETVASAIAPYAYKIIGASLNRLFLVDGAAKAGLEANASELVQYVEPDSTLAEAGVPNDTYYGTQWAMSKLDMLAAWDITTGKNTVLAAVIDSGVDRTHPELQYTDIRPGYNYYTETFCEEDYSLHGTAVTGVIAAQTNNAAGIAGVAWNVGIVPLNVSNPDKVISLASEIQAIYDAADMKCDVINISLYSDTPSDAERDAIDYAVARNIIVVAAAGVGDGTAYAYPASYDGVVSVSATNSFNAISTYTRHNDKVDVAAPGETVLGLLKRDKYENNIRDLVSLNGTSFSAPFVSGIAVLAKSLIHAVGPTQFMEVIMNTSTDLGATGRDNDFGYGLIDPYKALDYVRTKFADLNEPMIPTPTPIPRSPTPIPPPSTPTPTPVPTPTATLPAFRDLGSYPWARDAILTLARRGIINGVSSDRFMPEANITRADFLILIVKTLKLTADFTENFADVKPEDYFYSYVGIAKQLGIVSGVGENMFNPRTNITRQEMFVLTARALRLTGKLTTTGSMANLGAFTDTDLIASYAINDTAALVKIGLIAGSDNKINPTGYTIRAEAAVLVFKIYMMR